MQIYSPLSLIYFHQERDCLYIIDSGDGMTQAVIEEHWMTIGTDNKTNDIFTATGRVRAGAKGIGRFALDKLGDCCEMTTKPKSKEPSRKLILINNILHLNIVNFIQNVFF
jgi:hypothetical protein